MMPLPTPNELLSKLPLDEELSQFIQSSRETAKNIFLQKEPKVVLFVGPCSIHSPEAALEYATYLKKLSSSLKNIYIIMRFFHEKARSVTGWKGFFYDPDLNGSPNVEKGLFETRSLMLKILSLKIPLATEFLSPFTVSYFQDLITWGFIGSRTSTSQTHREIASSLPFPAGIKNNGDGNLDIAINSVIAAQKPHCHLSLTFDGKVCLFNSKGNPFAHIALRGSEKKANYDKASIQKLLKKMEEKNFSGPILIDCAHGNSQKSKEGQITSFQSVIKQIAKNKHIIGAMLESFLEEGNQPIDPNNLIYGLSITDPCLGWQDTEKLILWADHYLSNHHRQR